MIAQVTKGKDQEHLKSMMENIGLAKAKRVCFRPSFKIQGRCFHLFLDYFFETDKFMQMSVAQENFAEKEFTFIAAPDRLAFLCSVITCVEQLQKNFVLKINH